VIRELDPDNKYISHAEHGEIRLAALLHDIGHCLFSHGSEFFYRSFAEFQNIKGDDELKFANPSEAECVNYCILTCEPFKDMWKSIQQRCRETNQHPYIDSIDLKHAAQMIVGMAPEDKPDRRFQGDIINGPMDVDKLDYLERDGYFTGVNFSVDTDRLLPSLRTGMFENKVRGRKEKRLVVDHRGIAVVEQLLFARMLLYDTVYHHHKVRAANAALQSLLRQHHHRPVWPTKSGKLESITDFLDIDEYEFFGSRYEDQVVKKHVHNLRYRILPERALVLTPRALCDKESHTRWSRYLSKFTDREDPLALQQATAFFDQIRQKIVEYATAVKNQELTLEDVVVDIPDPPRLGKLGLETLIQIVPEYVVNLADLFPFHKVVSNYSIQYKYRAYVFAPEGWSNEVAYAAFRAFSECGIRVNDLALILAHKDKGHTRDLLIKANAEIPDWRKDFYTPDAEDNS
jgi:HD superfamily phosphohydrolase